jgi:LacI family transcriptional regulator
VKRSDKVSIIDVARQAGVSTATAGRVLGGYGYSSHEIRDKVMAAAVALGYRPNRLAKGLITGATQTIGVVAADIENQFYASVLRSISDVARGQGFGVIVTNSDENLQLETAAVQLLLEKQVDGIIVSPADLMGSRHLHDAVAAKCPIVQIDRVAKGLAADSVTVDNIGGARQCVARLIEAGHRRIGILAELMTPEPRGFPSLGELADKQAADLRNLYPSWLRMLGYLQAHHAAGLPIEERLIRRVGIYSSRAAKAQAVDLLMGSDRPTALFCADGMMSVGAMEAVNELGLSIPADLSLVCFDDLDWMKFTGPGITAASQPVHDLGRAAAELILGRISGDGAPHYHITLPVQLTERGSVRAPASTRLRKAL